MKKICQSCGMPMENDSVYGINSDGSKNGEYCKYCYTNGEFTAKVSMEEMINICVPFIVESGEMNEVDAKNMLNNFIPTLKRWSK